jgi:aspartyl-tRNA(Asn)/glutamyl-tRNA(Gln) amidotransferase subunit B
MQEGSLRVDANVNLHVHTPEGNVATPIVEIKNMNSFRAVERALDYEAKRQWDVWQETGQHLGDAPKQTRGWDDVAGVTRGQRSKEESSDYRYFPDPDLVPVMVTAGEVTTVRESLGELPAAIRSRMETDLALSAYDADVLVNQGRPVVDYFLDVARQSGDAKAAANWVTQDVLRTLKEQAITIDAMPVASNSLADLIKRVKSGEIPGPRAREVFQAMFEGRVDAGTAMAEIGITAVDESELIALCKELLSANPKTISDVQSGKVQAVGALIGQAKKKNPNVDPNRFRELCLQLISEMKS